MRGTTMFGTLLSALMMLFMLGPALPLFCQGTDTEGELHDWFSHAPEAAAYRTIQQDFFVLLSQALEAGIPQQLLAVKFKEGVAKGIPSGRLVSALRKEMERLIDVLSIIESAGYPGSNSHEEREQAVKMLGIILREGVPAGLLEEILSGGVVRGQSLASGAAACGAVFQVKKVAELPDRDLVRLGHALYESSLPSSSYDVLSSIFLRTRVHRLSDKKTLEIVLPVLEGGGGLIQLERELNRRIPR